MLSCPRLRLLKGTPRRHSTDEANLWAQIHSLHPLRPALLPAAASKNRWAPVVCIVSIKGEGWRSLQCGDAASGAKPAHPTSGPPAGQSGHATSEGFPTAAGSLGGPQQAELAADHPAMLGEAFQANLLRAVTFAQGVDALDAVGGTAPESCRGRQEDLRPVRIGPEEAKEARPLRDSGA